MVWEVSTLLDRDRSRMLYGFQVLFLAGYASVLTLYQHKYPRTQLKNFELVEVCEGCDGIRGKYVDVISNFDRKGIL